MSNTPVDVRVILSTEEAEAKATALQQKIDETVARARAARAVVIQIVREGLTLISSLMMSLRLAMSLFGQTMDPFFSSLIGMVLATSSMLISAGTVLVGTGIGAAVGAVVIGLAIGFNILTTAKLIADKEKTDQTFSKMFQELSTQIASGATVGGAFTSRGLGGF